VVLSFISLILSINTYKTVEVALWLNEKGIVLMGVGVLYLVLGFILTRVRHWRLKRRLAAARKRKH